MPYVTERWFGRNAYQFCYHPQVVERLSQIDKMMKDESYENIHQERKNSCWRARKPSCKSNWWYRRPETAYLPLFLLIDVKREHIAVAEAQKLNIPVFAMVDYKLWSSNIDFPIPANDDAFKSISIVTNHIGKAIEEALMERKERQEEAGQKRRRGEAQGRRDRRIELKLSIDNIQLTKCCQLCFCQLPIKITSKHRLIKPMFFLNNG